MANSSRGKMKIYFDSWGTLCMHSNCKNELKLIEEKIKPYMNKYIGETINDRTRYLIASKIHEVFDCYSIEDIFLAIKENSDDCYSIDTLIKRINK